MSEKLGPQAYEKSEGPVFLGMQSNKTREYSESKAQEIDEEVNHIIDHGYKTARQILIDHKDALERISAALLEYETIDGDEVNMLISGTAVSEIRKHRQNKVDESNGGLKAIVTDADAKKTNGSDPVGQPGSATT